MKQRIEKYLEDVPEEIRKEIKIPEFVYEKGKSSDCPTGTRGRMAVFEVVEMNRELERLILKGSPTDEEIMNISRKAGMTTIREDAVIKALEGHLAVSEVDAI